MSNISREVNRSKSVISRILKLYDDKKTFVPDSKSGRPRITTKRDDRVMKRYVDKDPFDSAAGISRKLKTDLGKEVSRYTVSRRLNEMGLKARTPATKPLISKKNKAARLTYAERHILWSDSDWDMVHFSDESKFNLVGSDGRQYVRRRSGARLNPKCVKKSVKFGGGSVMVWGMFSSAGVGPIIRIKGAVIANVYRNLLEQKVIPSLKESPIQPAIFIHDYAPCHTTKRVKQYLTEENIDVMDWPAQSPYLNPIENLWHIIGEQVRKRIPTTVDHLWSIIEDEWNKITPELCQKLSKSCGRRCAEVIENKGLHTSY